MKINKTEIKRLEKELLIANGKRRDRLLTMDEVFLAVRKAEEKLKKIPVKYWENCVIISDCILPNGYKYKAFYTACDLIFKKGSWRIQILREEVANKKSGGRGDIEFELQLSDLAFNKLYPREINL